MMQETAWLITTVSIATLAAVFIWVITRSRERTEYGAIQQSGYRWRKRLFVALAAAGIPLMGVTLMKMPYAAATNADAQALHVDAMGYQWYWEISESEAQVGQTVVFRVESADVNHGFGIYDESMRLVAQTQAMPGYTNELVHVFDQPGTYQILCLEYCGVAHHQMKAEFQVLTNQEEGGA
ncbi:cupredoxin domain-containing protein [Thiohalomonas denitrificans]|uniref:cytochrome-c oxidase n=1 Tax=Thiohalomonas denitrificans TaxID=415747 RepID=A0A1G5PIY5_9GAMM|nr:cytochrome C oxidase subunit II [Thiohalomonas denitrificans]SCZ49050.1 cytochrome c oxidase subunit 2 [Thiohalomonas denitrificans]